MVILPAKDPADVVDYRLTVSIPGIVPANVTSVTMTAERVTLGAYGIDGEDIFFWVSGGQPGSTAIIEITMNITGSRTVKRSVHLPIHEL